MRMCGQRATVYTADLGQVTQSPHLDFPTGKQCDNPHLVGALVRSEQTNA